LVSAILVYEYLLTFPAEVERFWPVWLKTFFDTRLTRSDAKVRQSHRREVEEKISQVESSRKFWRGCSFSWAASLFFLNRYVTMLGHIPLMVDYFGIHGFRYGREPVSA
jgi:hypothetical protein